MKPELTELSAGYLIEWDDQVRANANSFKLHSDGRITAEISIEANYGGSWQHIKKPAIINLSSDITRKRLANDCSERHGGNNLDWYAIIEQLSDKIITKHKTGEEACELSSGSGSKPPEYIMEPFIVKNYPNVFFGDPGSFKSNFAMVLCMIASLPYHDNPLNLDAPDDPLKILWLDWETDRQTVEWAMTRLENGLKPGIFFIQYRKCVYPLKQDVEQIKTSIDKTGADLVVIDSLGLASGGEPKETEPALSFFQALRQLKTTSLIIGHNSKNKEEKTKSIYGNMYYTALARNIWEARKVAEPGEDEIDIALFHRKSPPFSKIQKPFGYKVFFNFDSITISPQDITTAREFVSQLSNNAQIEMFLKEEGPASKQQILEGTGITDANFRQAIKRLKTKDKVVHLPGDNWGLKYNG